MKKMPSMFSVSRRDVIRAIVTVLISFVCFSVMGTLFVATAFKRNNEALCEIIVTSAVPLPKPPSNDPNAPAPTTPYGKELAKYNDELAARASRIQIARVKATKKYHCPSLASLDGK